MFVSNKMKTIMFTKYHRFNKISTLVTTIPWLLIGSCFLFNTDMPKFFRPFLQIFYVPTVLVACLLPFFGFYQYLTSLILLVTKKTPTSLLPLHISYSLLALFIIVTQVMLLFEYHPIFSEDSGYIFTIGGGIILAYVHLYITKEFKDKEVRNA